MKAILYATTNTKKREYAAIAVRDYAIAFTELPHDFPEVFEIQSDSQVDIAIDKAQKYFEILKQPLVAMDSGLFINSLRGFPGVYTKYALSTLGTRGLIDLASGLDDRSAYTERTVVYIDSAGTKTFSWRCDGKMLVKQTVADAPDY